MFAALEDILSFVLAPLPSNSQLPVPPTPGDLIPSLASVGACAYVTEKLTQMHIKYNKIKKESV